MDGISITQGLPRQHIWSYVVGIYNTVQSSISQVLVHQVEVVLLVHQVLLEETTIVTLKIQIVISKE